MKAIFQIILWEVQMSLLLFINPFHTICVFVVSFLIIYSLEASHNALKLIDILKY